MKYLSLILRNVARNRLRTALTVLGVAFLVFVLVFAMTALTEMMAWEGEAATSLRVVVQHSTGLATSLPIGLENYLKGDVISRHAEHVIKLNWYGGYYQDPKNWFANFATDQDTFDKLFDELVIPPDDLRRFREVKTGTLVGEALMRKFGWKVGQRVTLIGTFYPANPDLLIVGTFRSKDIRQEEQMFFRYDYFDELLGGRKLVGTYWMKARTPRDIPRLKELIDGHTKNSSDPTETITEKEFAAQFMEMMGNVKGTVLLVTAIVLGIMILMTANTMAMSVRERVTEVAVLRTLGFTAGRIVYFVVAESVLLALLGAALALGAFFLLFNVLRLSPVPQFFPYFFLQPVTVAVALGAAVKCGLASAAVPAFRAARMKIVDGLRQVA